MCGDARSGATTLPRSRSPPRSWRPGSCCGAVAARSRPSLFSTCTHGVIRLTPNSGIPTTKVWPRITRRGLVPRLLPPSEGTARRWSCAGTRPSDERSGSPTIPQYRPYCRRGREPCGANHARAERSSAKRLPDDHMDYHGLRGPSRSRCRSAPRGPAGIAAALLQPPPSIHYAC